MLSVGFEPIISAGERPHIYALDRVVTGTVGNSPFGSIKSRGFLDQLSKINFAWGTAPMEVVKSISRNCSEIIYNRDKQA